MLYNVCMNKKYYKVKYIALFLFFSLTVFLFIKGIIGLPVNIENGSQESTKNENKVFVDDFLEEKLKDLHGDNIITEDKNKADILLTLDNNSKYKIQDSAKMYYVPITGFFNKTKNINFENLRKIFKGEIKNWQDIGGEDKEIKIIFNDKKESSLIFRKFFDAEIIGDEFGGDLIEKISSNYEYISIVPVNDISPAVNEILIDNFSAFDKKENHPLNIKINLFAKDNISADKLIFYKEFFNELNSEVIEIKAVGDIMLSRHVGTKILNSGDNSLSFRKLYSFLSSSDITFGNLESPFNDKGPVVKEGMVFKAEPQFIEGLKLAGFDIVSLANNHFGNQGRSGMLYSFQFLKENGIFYVGAGKDSLEAHNYILINKKGTNINFLSYNEISPESYRAKENLPGISWISDKEEDILQMKKDIEEAKKNSDILFVSFHWGNEYTPNPTLRQIKIAKEAIDSGADIIIAHHPHVVQAVQIIDNKFIAYSLGNFVFDQMWSEETREGLIARIFIKNKKVLKVDLIPIKIEDYNQPRFASESESKNIIERIYKASLLISKK